MDIIKWKFSWMWLVHNPECNWREWREESVGQNVWT
jgi:hypothetical protein